jgi:4-amino-4-deoxy-L-arabinose transferase-like glycosyltransferase
MNLFKSKNNILLILIILLTVILRFVWLDRIPPALYTDEADQGYNAYSIIKTLRDEHGNFLPLSFRSFGDWKPPLPTYLMVPFIYLFGLNEIAVRLPSVILGVGSVLIIYFLVREIFVDKSNRNKIGLLAVLFLAVSPWHILQSRSAMLVITSLFFFESGVWLFLLGLRKKYILVLSSLMFVLSIYSYYGMRIITPLFLLFLLIYYRNKILLTLKSTLIATLLGVVLLIPLGISFLKESDVFLGRAKTVSVFYDQGVRLTQWKLITQDGIDATPLVTRFFHNVPYMYFNRIIKNFLIHFDPQYLFVIGDTAPPFQIPGMGILFLTDGVLIIIGVVVLMKYRYPSIALLFIWLLLSILPASLTFMIPASNRTFNVVIIYTVLASLGLYHLYRKIKYKRVSAMIFCVILILNTVYSMNQYFLVLPNKYANWWNYGWKETVSSVAKIQSKYNDVVVSDINGMPYIYFLFYQQFDPKKYQETALRTYVADRFGFEHVEGFDKYYFPNNLYYDDVIGNLQPKTIYVIPSSQVKGNHSSFDTIYYPDGQPVNRIITNE